MIRPKRLVRPVSKLVVQGQSKDRSDTTDFVLTADRMLRMMVEPGRLFDHVPLIMCDRDVAGVFAGKYEQSFKHLQTNELYDLSGVYDDMLDVIPYETMIRHAATKEDQRETHVLEAFNAGETRLQQVYGPQRLSVEVYRATPVWDLERRRFALAVSKTFSSGFSFDPLKYGMCYLKIFDADGVLLPLYTHNVMLVNEAGRSSIAPSFKQFGMSAMHQRVGCLVNEYYNATGFPPATKDDL